MPNVSWGDYNAWSNRQGNAFGKAVQAAKAGACDLYRNYPRWATGVGLFDNPGAAFARGTWDTMCSDDPGGLPSPVPQPFDGGQCNGAVYDVSYFATANVGTPQEGDITGVFRCYGEVTNAPVIKDGASSFRGGFYCRGVPPGPVSPEPVFIAILTSSDFESSATATITDVVLVSGSDDCGDPPLWYPPSLQDDPPPEAITKNDYHLPDLGLAVPFFYTPIDLNLNVNIDVGGVNVKFDVEGINFNFNYTPPQNGGGGDPLPSPPSSPGDIADGIDNLGDKIDNLGDKIDNLPDQFPEPPPPKKPSDDPSYDKEEKDPTDPKQEDDLPETLVYVEIKLTKLPIDRKQQYGEGSPNVYYAGWFEWTSGGKPLPREPIAFESSLFRKPDYADGYAYTLTNRAEGYAVEYYE